MTRWTDLLRWRFGFGFMANVLAILIVAAVFATQAQAANCTSRATGGNWNAGATWLAGCGATGPVAGDTVVIATTGASFVTVNVPTAAVASVAINAGSILTQTQSLTTTTLAVNGTLTSNNAVNVTGTTTVTGTLTINGAGARNFTGNVAINAGTWNNSGNRAVTFGGSLTNNATFTGGTGLQTFSNASPSILGTGAINFGGGVTGTSALTINKAAGAVTVTGALTVGATGLTVTAGTLNLANTVNVTGPTSITGTLAHTTATGTRTFTGAVTINGTGIWSEAAAANISFGINLSNSGTFTSSTGTHTFTAATANLLGSTAITFGTGTVTANNLTINKTAGAITTNGTLQVNGNLTIIAGALNLANTTNVTGTTSVTGTLAHTTATGTRTFTGAVTINGGGTISEAAAAVITFGNNLTNNGATYTTSTGLHTFSNAAPTISGSSAISFGGAVTGTTALTINKSAGAVTVNGTLTVGATGLTVTAGTLNIANTATITGPTSVTGILAHTSATGTRTFTGAVTINAGGTWSETAAAAISYGNNLSNSGTFNSSTGTHTFTAATANLLGNTAITFGTGTVTTNNLTINMTASAVTTNGTLQVNGNLTITAGTLNLANTTNITGTTNVTGVLGNTTATGTRTFTGAVTINAGGTMSAAAAATINLTNNLVNNGTLTGGTANWTLSGATNSNAGTFTPGTGTWTLNRAGAQTFPAATYQVLALAGSGAKTSSAGTLTVNGTLSTIAGVNLAGNTNNTTVSVPGSITNAGTLTGGTNTWTVTGTTVSSGTITGGTGAWTLNGALTTSGSLTIPTLNMAANVTNSGGTFNVTTLKLNSASAWTSSAAANTWTIGTLNLNSQALSFSAPADTFTINLTAATPIANAGTINAGGTSKTITINYSPNAAQTVQLTGITYPNLSLSGGNTKTLGTAAAQTLNIVGSLTIAAGVTMQGNTNNPTVNVGGNITNSGTFNAGTGTWTLNGTAAQAIGGTTATSYRNLTISNTAATVTANTNFSIVAGGILTMNGAATVLAPAAAVIVSGAGTLTGTGTVQVTRTAATADFSSQYSITNKTLTNLTVEYIGAAAQTVSTVAYGGMKISNGSGVTLAGNTTVSGILNLNSGVVTTNANILTTSTVCPASVTRTNGYVLGNLRLTYPNGAATCLYPVGSGGVYAPMSVTMNATAAGGTLTGTTATGEHPQIATSNLDSLQDVNRYWTLGATGDNNTLPPLGTYSVTFTIVAAEVDAGADATTFKVNRYNTSWQSPAGTATSTSATLSGQTAFGSFAVGQINVSSFNAFETSTAANAILGNIYTKLAGTAFSLDVVAITSSSAQSTGFSDNVKLELLANSGTAGSGYGSDFCPTANGVIQTVASAAIANGRSTVNFAAVNNVYRDVRVRISYPTASPTVTTCSQDSFSIRPKNFIVSSSDAANSAATGTPAIKAGANFNLTATAQADISGVPTTMTLYAGTVSVVDNTNVIGSPNQGTISGSFAAPAVAGVATGSTFTYSEVGNFGLNVGAVHDDTFTSIDTSAECTNDFSSTLVGGKYGCKIGNTAVAQTTGSSGFGRFIPDHFAVTTSTLTPACVSSAFTYMGQPFTVNATVQAQNSSNAVTANYQGIYAAGTVNIVAEDQTAANQATDLGSRISGLGSPAWNSGQYAIATSAAVFSRPTAPVATPLTPNGGGPFDLLTVGVKVSDPDGPIITSPTMNMRATTGGVCTTPGTLTATDCDAAQIGTAMKLRYGRLRLDGAYGSNLLPLFVPVRAEFVSGFNGATPVFTTNTLDNCTAISSSAIAIGASNPAGLSTSASTGATLSSGQATIKLAKPSGATTVATVDLAINLGNTGVTADVSCNATHPATTAANMAYLQWTWCSGKSDPSARVKFGSSKAPYIYMREKF